MSDNKCPTCGSSGFETSWLGRDRCEFCDGTFGGNPPTKEDMQDRIESLKRQTCLVTREARHLIQQYKQITNVLGRGVGKIAPPDGFFASWNETECKASNFLDRTKD